MKSVPPTVVRPPQALDGATVLVVALHPPAGPATPYIYASDPPAVSERPSMPTVATPMPTCDDADHDIKRRSRLALAVTLRDLHRYTSDAMQIPLVDGAPPGGYTACSRRIAFLTKRVTVMQILCDRVATRTSWAVIARHLGRTEDDVAGIYGPMETAWRTGSLAPWAPEVPGAAVGGLMPIDLAGVAEADLLPYMWAHRASRPVPPPN